MKRFFALMLSFLSAVAALSGGSFTNLVSFSEETKIKGGFTEVEGRLYFACEKGGANNFGYIGRFDPTTGTLERLYNFTTDAKPKGGLTRMGGHLYFQAEKGSATTTWGWIGQFDPAARTVTEAHAYTSDVKPKSGFIAAGGALYFMTEKGGAANQGMIERFTPGGGVATLASLALTDGIKIESLAYDAAAHAIYYGAREGGDLTQLAGKGAGAIGRMDASSGALTKVADFHNEHHGAKIRGLTFHAGRLWFVLEEGANLAYETGKGGGALASCDPATGQITRHHAFDGATGLKPRSLVAAGGDLYFATEKGGASGLGTFGVWRDGARFEILGEFDAATGAKPDFVMSAIGNRIYFAPELGTSGFLGGISAYEFAEPAVAGPLPALAITRLDGKLRVTWPAAGAGFALEAAPTIDSTAWHPHVGALTADGDRSSVEITPDAVAVFFRLRRP